MRVERRDGADPGLGQPHSPPGVLPFHRPAAEGADPGLGQPHSPRRLRGDSASAPATASAAAPAPAAATGWKAVGCLATRQHGWIHRSQLRAAGLDREAVRHAVRTGRLFPRRGELFLVGHEYLAAKADLAAALLVAGPGAVLSHRSAAAEWGLFEWSGSVEVTARVHRRTTRNVKLHRAGLDARRDVTRRHGLPVTSLLRTIVDCAAVMTEPELERSINEAAIKGWLHARNVAALLAMVRGRRGARRLRRVVEARDRSKGWTRSTLERAFADVVRAAGLPPYERGGLVDIGDDDFRECDVTWRARRVMVELDFLPIHETGRVPYRDRRRDRRLAAAGWTVIRITGDDLTHHRDEVIVDLRAALQLHA